MLLLTRGWYQRNTKQMHKIYIKVLLLTFLMLQCNSFAEPLTLMSFNIRYDNSKDGENRWELRKEHVAEVIREQKPDVIAIQEAVSSQMKFLRDEFKNLIPIGEHTGGLLTGI